MKKITKPSIDDIDVLDQLCSNTQVDSYPHLKEHLTTLTTAYSVYENFAGNAHRITSITLPGNIKNYLKKHYNSPPKAISHITEIRRESEHLGCPMCGSFSSGSLDHFLPKNSYLEFSIYSHNLVPACKCNSVRGETIIGTNASERILHPYYDECLSERLMTIEIESLGAMPRISLRIIIGNEHPEYDAISFHIRRIVEKTSVIRHMNRMWGKLCIRPSLIVRCLKHNPTSIENLRNILTEELYQLDDYHESKNNWDSIFISGLLQEEVTNWLYEKMTGNPNRQPNSPLIY